MKGLSNPVAIAAASSPEIVKAGKEVVINYTDRAMSTARLFFGIVAGGITLWWANGKYKEWRRQKFVEENAHLPDVQAAMIFRKAMFKVEFNAFPFGLIQLPDGTDEATLNSLALRISSFQNVIKAYKILFDSNLVQDVYEELNNKELQRFFDRLNATDNFNQGFNQFGQVMPQKRYSVGQTLYIGNPKGATLWKAEETSNGKYKNSGESIEFKKFNERVGDIIAVYKSTSSNQHFYVVDRYLAVDTIFGYGWIQHTDVKVK